MTEPDKSSAANRQAAIIPLAACPICGGNLKFPPAALLPYRFGNRPRDTKALPVCSKACWFAGTATQLAAR